MKTLTYLKKLSRSASRSIRRLLRHLTGKSIVSATLTPSIPPFIKLELGFKQESSSTGPPDPTGGLYPAAHGGESVMLCP